MTGDQLYKAIKLGWVDWKPEVGETQVSIEDLERNLERIKKLPRSIRKKSSRREKR